MAEVVGGVLYGLKNLAEGAALIAKGIYDPTLPLKATLQPLTTVDLPLAYHSVSVIKGRAYAFGGKTVDSDGDGTDLVLAKNDLHILILPTSGFESLDYKHLEPTSNSPPPRYGHSAAIIDESIYIFGGSGADGHPLDENGRVWVYNTISNKWNHLDPATQSNSKSNINTAPHPDPRTSHAAIATPHPRPPQRPPVQDILPQQPPDAEALVPDIPEFSTYGTLIVQGGRARSGNNLIDVWAFDIRTRTWTELPEPPGPSSPAPSLALVESRLYTFSAGQVSFLDLNPAAFQDNDNEKPTREKNITPLQPWHALPPTSSAPDKPFPGERSAVAMNVVTTGQGRNYLLLIGGMAHGTPSTSTSAALEDIWTLQLPPSSNSAAKWKDAARERIGKATREAEWEEVLYYNSDGVMVQEGQDGRGIGRREGCAVGRLEGVDGESVLVWGGVGDRGGRGVRGDGVLVRIDC